MYGKIFDSIYDGTLRADWKALVTFQQLIILCNADGVVDMTPHAIHGRTGIPFDIIEHGLKVLAEPDPQSRSATEEGRRIVLIDPSRPWGWRLVNHAYYRNLISREDKKEKDRVRIAQKRANESGMSQCVADSREKSLEVANVAHTYTEADTNTDTNNNRSTSSGGEPDAAPTKKRNYKAEAVQVLEFLNEKANRQYRALDDNGNPTAGLRIIIDRLKTGVSLEDARSVVALMCRKWGTDDKMRDYLRPSTLFRPSKFEDYLGMLRRPQ